jgi:hypothetical protein
MRAFQVVLLALTLGSASAVSAQQSEPNRKPRGERPGLEQQGGRPDFLAGLLRGIELSAAQQERVIALREQYRPAGPGMRGAPGGRERGDSARARGGQRPEGRSARGDSMRAQRGVRPEGRPERRDTAQMRQNREQGRARMEAQREQMTSELRAILTPAQRPQFDQNLQQMKARFEQGAARRPRGGSAAPNGLRSR